LEEYVSDEEYPTYFMRLRGLRRSVAASLPLEHGMKILDIATGSAYFAMELVRFDESLKITGVDISERSFEMAKRNIGENDLEGRLEVKLMDASRLRFKSSSFDMVVNFLGLEDIHMTRGLGACVRPSAASGGLSNQMATSPSSSCRLRRPRRQHRGSRSTSSPASVGRHGCRLTSILSFSTMLASAS